MCNALPVYSPSSKSQAGECHSPRSRRKSSDKSFFNSQAVILCSRNSDYSGAYSVSIGVEDHTRLPCLGDRAPRSSRARGHKYAYLIRLSQSDFFSVS